MPALLDCPRIESWQQFFADALPSGERDLYECHLESCPVCQERLDRVEECEDALRTLGRRVGDPTAVPADPTLEQFMERLHDAKETAWAPSTESAELYFLHPSDQEGVLGTMGEYEVQEVIGQGGMGVVLKAFDPTLHRLVAIKVMAACVAGSATARRRFTREAHAAAAVCHDNIVAVHRVHEADGLPYLVMQYVAGESLQMRLDRGGPLELVEIVRIGLQTAAGLAAAHAQGLIHRDIKPANLLLETRSQESGVRGQERLLTPDPSPLTPPKVKITDFGLARMTDDVQLTRNGVVAGTPEYMAPEQARGERVDHRADLFSLGCVLYACCTGKPPFGGNSAVAVLRQVSDVEPVPLRSLNPQVPAWLEVLIGRLLAKDPEQRIQSAAEVAALLEGYLAHLQQPVLVNAPALHPLPVSRSARSRRRPGPRAHPPLIWLAFGMLLAALALTVALGLQGGDGPRNQGQDAGQDKQGRAHMKFDFRNGIDNFPALSLQGPDVDEVAKTDSQGLRVSIPEGQADTRPIELELAHRLHGDFDIILGYELIAVGKPVPKYGAGVVIRVWFDSPSSPCAILSRTKKPPGDCFGAHKTLVGPDGKDQYLNNVNVKATSSKGKLRLVRTGPKLQYFVAEDGQDFKVIQSVEIGTDDVRDIKVLCHTMHTPIALDVRLTELVIDADQFPNGMPAAEAAIAPVPAPTPARRVGGLLIVVLGAGSLVAFAAVGVWICLRRRDHTPTTPTADPGKPLTAPGVVAVTCASCGKSLKARAELGGKKVKCSQCGKATLVPMTRGIKGGRIPS